MDLTLTLAAITLAGAATLLAAARLLGEGHLARRRLAPARLELPPTWYASARAPAGGAAARPAADAPVASRGVDTVARRKLLRWFGWTTLLVLLAEMAAGFLPFFWPRRTGSFGGRVAAGSVNDYKVGEVKKVVEGKFFISRVPEGFLALWQKCPHLGCSVPWQENQQSEDRVAATGRFNCPCHGSIYDRYGQIITGPAPRPMDMFPITIQDGRLFVETGPSAAKERVRADHQTDPVPA